MRRIRVLICSIEEDMPEEMTELASFDLPATDVTALHPETALDELETTTHETGNAILRRVLQAQWDLIDARLTELHRQRFPAEQVTADGHAPITVASRIGTLELKRQVCSHADTQTHVMRWQCCVASASRHHSHARPARMGVFVAPGLALCRGRPPPWVADP